MGLESLSPNRRTQYDALLPEVERSVRSAQNARGGFYSGAAVDAEAKAKAELLAKLAAQDASEQASSSENARDRELTTKIKNEEIKAGKRNALLGILGTGVGAAATLGGLKYMNPGGGSNVVAMNGRLFEKGPKGAWVDVTPGAGGVGTVGAPRPPIDMVASPGGGNLFEAPNAAQELIAGDFGPRVPSAPVPAGVAPAAPSMWKNAIAPKSLGAGAIGGGLGYLGARAAGADSTEGAIGSGLGGLGGYLAAARYGGGNPWAAGAGALFGSFGGGLLGNLFK